MQREALRQRIEYLVQHGGIHPQEPVDKYQIATLVLLGLVIALQVADLFIKLH